MPGLSVKSLILTSEAFIMMSFLVFGFQGSGGLWRSCVVCCVVCS